MSESSSPVAQARPSMLPWEVVANTLPCVWRPREERHPYDRMCQDRGEERTSCEAQAKHVITALAVEGYVLVVHEDLGKLLQTADAADNLALIPDGAVEAQERLEMAYDETHAKGRSQP